MDYWRGNAYRVLLESGNKVVHSQDVKAVEGAVGKPYNKMNSDVADLYFSQEFSIFDNVSRNPVRSVDGCELGDEPGMYVAKDDPSENEIAAGVNHDDLK